jgi:hypothetical protein
LRLLHSLMITEIGQIASVLFSYPARISS